MDLAKTRAKLIELMEPGVLGFYTSVEITEIRAFTGKKTVNGNRPGNTPPDAIA